MNSISNRSSLFLKKPHARQNISRGGKYHNLMNNPIRPGMDKLNLNISDAVQGQARAALGEDTDEFLHQLEIQYRCLETHQYVESLDDGLPEKQVRAQAKEIRKIAVALRKGLEEADHYTEMAISFDAGPPPFWHKDPLLEQLSDLITRIETSISLSIPKGRPIDEERRKLVRIYILAWRSAKGKLPKKYSKGKFCCLIDALQIEAGFKIPLSWTSIESEINILDNEIKNRDSIKKGVK